MIEEDSAGFVEAFTAAVRPHEKRGRPLRWMLLVAFAVVFAAALGSLLNGAFGSGSSGDGGSGTSLLGASAPATVPLGGITLPATATATATGSATATASATPKTWTGVAGPECIGSGAEFTESGFSLSSANAAAEWAESGTGGFRGEDCAGGYVSMPVSGSATAFDADRYALWTFTLGNGLSSGASCKLDTYVPSSTSTGLVGGAPADYYYYASAYTGSQKALGDYAVEQTTNPGRWLSTGSFTVESGVVSVRLVDAGANQGIDVVRVAAAQVRLTCTAS